MDHMSVQAFITTLSFPKTLADAEQMGMKNAQHGRWYTDLDTLLDARLIPSLVWTAPRWAALGDIVLFYCTQSAAQRSEALYRQAMAQQPTNPTLVALLARAVATYARYAGSIFAVAQIVGPAAYEGLVPGHFKSVIFAEPGERTVFAKPLPAAEFKEYVRIGQSTITPLYGSQIEGLRSLLATNNHLPPYFAQARFGTGSLRAVTAANWDTIVTEPELRFVHEEQLRRYWLDYLLDAVKDPRSPRLEECQCYQGEAMTGIADYCIQVAGQWLPVEAKLNTLTERDLLGQIRRYVGAERFVPTRGAHHGRVFRTPTSTLCLIADQQGVYVAQAGRFVAGKPGQPHWRREELRRTTIPQFRAWLMQAMEPSRVP
jgi:hypothetical protein